MIRDEMRSYFVPAITVAMIMPGILSARSDDIPTLDVRPVCRGIASQSELEAGLQRTTRFSQDYLNRIARRLNQRPRKTLGFETPADRLQAVLH
jgi:hypothetical protein